MHSTFSPLGLFPSGDFGPWTIYTNKNHRIVQYLRAPPTSPPTAAQQRQRNAWSAVAELWSTLLPSERLWWQNIASRGRLRITAFNLFMHYHLTEDKECLLTLTNP